jgi:quinoprotein glucose dehydrogenase
MRRLVIALAPFVILPLPYLEAQHPDKPYNPAVAAASDEPAKAMKRIRVPAGLRLDLFAAEPMLANPVCFCVDEKNRFYVAETFRLHAGVTDIRGHMDWLDDDLACRTVEDRVAMYRRKLGKNFPSYEREHERVRLIEDAKGEGKADRATVFADGFHRAEDGVCAGLLARRGNVYFACIPDLWLLQDTKGTGKADVRKSLNRGYGVHVGFIGHDLHGLRMGPDGKLYFSLGDRGVNVKVGERSVSCPDAGAVLRCNPDGSELELFATGLRNPQELAFDQYGNLFTCDNNADGGDQARVVYVVDGGDSGWRIGYQHLHQPMQLGAWNAEKLWRPQWDGQAAYLVPPLANLANGPSGFTFNPGAALLPERYRDHFFLADFRGGSGNSGIRSFALKPKGAAFEVTDSHEFVWSVLATDVDFGTDGALYIADWVEGWGKPNKGRLWKVHDPSLANDAAAASVKKLLAEGFERRPIEELAKLLEHVDMRVRLEAQFTLAERGAAPALEQAARKGETRLARLHGIWGLGQVGRKTPAAYKPIVELLADKDAEVRAQAAKVLGEGRVAASFEPLLPLLKDSEPRVQFFAAISLGKLGKAGVEPLLDVVRKNADRDPYLRHAGVMGLTGCNDVPALLKAAEDSSPAVRMATLLALRRLGNPEVARFLSDSEPSLAVEAARAINDEPIVAAMPALAALAERSRLSEPLWYRVLNANFRLGGSKRAAAVATVAGRADVPEAVRVEALRMLRGWEKPSGRDRVVGVWRPLEPRPAAEAADAFRAALGGVFSGPEKVRSEGAQLAAALGIKEVGPVLFDLAFDSKNPPAMRVEMLRALDAIRDARVPEAMKKALADDDPRVRTQGRRLLARLQPAEAVPALERVLENGTVVERQGACETLAELKSAEADAVLSRALDRLLAKQVPEETVLDLLEAAAKRPTADIKARLAKYEAARPKNDHLARFREALQGGDAESGRRIFFSRAEVSCLRCHKVKGEGGEVGPDLFGIGAKQKRDYILESIVDPNRQIAQGFDTVVVTTTKGQTYSGVLKMEDAKQLRLITPEGKVIVVPKDQIDERQKGKSAMPEDLIKHLSKRDLRDLVEFLAGLK